MIKKCFFIFIIFVLMLNGSGFEAFGLEKRTALGVFYLPEPELNKSAGLKVTRKILKDSEIKSFYQEIDAGVEPKDIKPVRLVREFRQAGVDMIITLRWPQENNKNEIVNGFGNPAAFLDRVPKGVDRDQSLALLKRFLNDFGPDLAVISLQNECLGGPGRYAEADMLRASGESSAAGAWLREVAQTVRTAISENPKLSHLKIASPVWQGMERFSKQGDMIPSWHENPKVAFIGEIVEISNRYCDYVDLHFLQVSLEDIRQIISFVKKHTTLPLITTEWAGLKGVMEWLKEPADRVVLKRLKKSFPRENIGGNTNKDLVDFAQKKRVPVKDWNMFLASMPHEEDFALKSFKIFEQEGFVYACWALGLQYGDTLFDLNTLFANRKTSERYAPNEPAYSDFQRVIKYLGGTPWLPNSNQTSSKRSNKQSK